MLDFNPFEQARQQSEVQGQGFGGSTSWFGLKDGETKYLRFLNGLVDYVTVSHSCGVTLVDIKKTEFEAAKAAGMDFDALVAELVRLGLETHQKARGDAKGKG